MMINVVSAAGGMCQLSWPSLYESWRVIGHVLTPVVFQCKLVWLRAKETGGQRHPFFQSVSAY